MCKKSVKIILSWFPNVDFFWKIFFGKNNFFHLSTTKEPFKLRKILYEIKNPTPFLILYNLFLGIVNHLREVTDLVIDIFGKCSDKEHQLPKQTSSDIEETLKNRGILYKEKLKNYKFYLSFENSLCQDYITEKFFLALYAGTLPIAYGGLSKSDYEKGIFINYVY